MVREVSLERVAIEGRSEACELRPDLHPYLTLLCYLR